MCKKPGVCRAVHAPPRSVLAVSRVVADRLPAVERLGVWQMWDVRAAETPEFSLAAKRHRLNKLSGGTRCIALN